MQTYKLKGKFLIDYLDRELSKFTNLIIHRREMFDDSNFRINDMYLPINHSQYKTENDINEQINILQNQINQACINSSSV